jgi:prevent-host-death family protein
MVAVTATELKARADELLRQLEETGEPVEITRDGRVVAMLVAPIPLDDSDDRLQTQEELDAFWAEFDQLAEDIGAAWTEGVRVSAVDAIRDVRREL